MNTITYDPATDPMPEGMIERLLAAVHAELDQQQRLG